MDGIEVKLCWLIPANERDLHPPHYETIGAAGMDVEAGVQENIVLQPGERVLIPTGFGVALPEGYELQVRPRSGLAVQHGITILNSPGTIDADYRGEVKIALVNLGKDPYTIHRGARIAQLVLAPVVRAVLREVKVLDKTDRDAGGFGHTGG
ncbi:dUTP diphosphatase [Desulfopila sp. IMCC35006]|uniref:dUTP diphosphatase n=1 Tax=Desulfopila sp. IMCC35006 TaxID=2569542 RepID=UPI0010ABED9B|nr:dUTP diphosphatase [Desulfopila sp. IMCC35006]TKB26654.1 dUTP diphosphatase [Desulfopila sp. IMCC35006]